MSKLKAPIQEKNSQALIEEADKLFEIKEYNKAEYVYAEALRIADRGLEKDYNTQLICFQKLGDIYLEYKEYPKATALYNTALILAKDKFPDNKFHSQNQEQVQNNLQSSLIAKIKNTEKLFLREALEKEIDETLVSSYELDKEHKQHLVELRNRCRKEIERIDREYNPYVKEGYDPLIPEIRILEIKRAEAINELYKSIATDIKSLIKEMLKKSYDVLGNPPCKYSIIALGSLAREEATPYSDFEWAILIEEGLTKENKEEAKEYFRNLTKLMHIKVINIGETILPSMHIKSLNNFYSKDQIKDNWFYDEITPRGFGFDGLMPKACKIPLGTRAAAPNLKEGEIDSNGKEIYELIRTPKEMAQFQNEKWYEQDNLLGNGMSTFVLIEGDEELAKRYREEIEEVSKDLKDIKKKEVLELLKRDIVTYDTRLDEPNEEGKLYEVKKEIYRLPDRTIDGIGAYYNLKSNSSWDRINELEKEGIINNEARDNLHIAVGIATEVRLRTYLKSDKQKETMNAIHLMFKAKEKLEESKEKEQNQHLQKQQQQQITEQGTTEEELKEIFLLPSQEMLFRFYYTILPLEEKIRSSLSDNEIAINHESNNNNIAIELLSKHEANIANNENNKNNNLFDDGNLNRGLVYGRLLQYEKAREHFEQELNTSKYKHNVLIYTRLAYIYLNTTKVDKAVEYSEQALKLKKTRHGRNDIALVGALTNLGNAYNFVGDNDKSIKCYKKALAICEALPSESVNVARTLNNLGATYGVIGDSKNHIEYLKQSLKLMKQIYGSKHLEVASIFNNLAGAYLIKGDYNKTILYLEKALNIKEAIYGSKHPEVASIFNNLAEAYQIKGDYNKTILYLEKALKVMEAVFDEANVKTVSVLSNLANAYRDIGDNENDIKCLEKALYRIETIYGSKHAKIVYILINLGAAYSSKGNFNKSITLLERALKIIKNTNRINYREAASIFHNLAEAYRIKGDYNKSIFYARKALSIYNDNATDKSNRLEITDTLISLGSSYGDIGDFNKSITLLEKALKTMENIYEKNHLKLGLIYKNLSISYDYNADHYKAYIFAKKTREIYLSPINKVSWKYQDFYTINNLITKSSIILGNKAFLEDDIKKAKEYYNIIKENYNGIEIDPYNFLENIQLAELAYQHNHLILAIQHTEIVAKLNPNDVLIHYNLGRFYHIEAKQALIKGNTELYKERIKAVEDSFLKVLEKKENENSGLYAEYSNFLYMTGRIKEALPYILRATELKDDKIELCYGTMAKLTLDKNLQKEVGYKKEIKIKASYLVYYILITNHNEFSFNKDEELNKQQIISYITEFEQEVIKEPNPLSYSLLGYFYKAIGEYGLAKEIFKKVIEIDSENYVAGSNYLECNKVIREKSNIDENNNNNNVSIGHNDITSKRKLASRGEELSIDKAASIIQRSWREYIDMHKEEIHRNI